MATLTLGSEIGPFSVTKPKRKEKSVTRFRFGTTRNRVSDLHHFHWSFFTEIRRVPHSRLIGRLPDSIGLRGVLLPAFGQNYRVL